MPLRVVFVRVGDNPRVQAQVTKAYSASEVQRDFDRDVNKHEENEKMTVVGFFEGRGVHADVLHSLCQFQDFEEGLDSLLTSAYNLNRNS